MPSPLRILHVDDESEVRSVGPSHLKELLTRQGIESEIDAVESLDSARKKLEKGGYHVAIVDLHLAEKGGGNEVLRSILAKKILPIIIYTGYRMELDPDFEDHGFIYVAEKKKMEYVADKIVEWNAKKVLDFFSEDGFIGSTLHKTLLLTMWGHVSRYWEYLEKEDIETLSRTAGRIAATLFHDELISSPAFANDAGEVCIHHGEIYVFDTPRKHLAVGDVIKAGSEPYIVLTPACDLVPRPGGSSKAKEVLVARCQDFAKLEEEDPEFRKRLEKLRCDSGPESKSAKWFEKLMRHAESTDEGRRFFLPPFAKFGGGVIDFLQLKVLPCDEEQHRALIAGRTLSLNREMAAELSARFARYMMRLGQAPYLRNPLIEAVLKATEPKI